jgi:hypothetical protein
MSEYDGTRTTGRKLRPAPCEPRVSDKIRAAAGEERGALIERLPWETGYAKPPVATRFEPGKSGNPKGRPRGRKNLRTVIEGVLEETVPVREGGRRRTMTKIEVVIRQTTKKAMGGDAKATDLILKQAAGLGLLGSGDDRPMDAPIADPQLLQAIWDHLAMQNAFAIQARTHEEGKE